MGAKSMVAPLTHPKSYFENVADNVHTNLNSVRDATFHNLKEANLTASSNLGNAADELFDTFDTNIASLMGRSKDKKKPGSQETSHNYTAAKKKASGTGKSDKAELGKDTRRKNLGKKGLYAGQKKRVLPR
jgi:hypothetical protein